MGVQELMSRVRSLDSSLFPEASITAAQYELVKKTNMVDYMGQLFEQVHPGKPSPFGASLARCDEVVKRGEQGAGREAACGPVKGRACWLPG
jgi:hypothetical protein